MAPPHGTIARQRRWLQLSVAIASLIPVAVGLSGALMGTRMLDEGSIDPSQDSQFRYLSGLLLAIGVCYWSLVPTIERAGPAIRLLTFIVFIGGMARLAGLFTLGLPSRYMMGGLAMELAVAPLLCLWQTRLAHHYRAGVIFEEPAY